MGFPVGGTAAWVAAQGAVDPTAKLNVPPSPPPTPTKVAPLDTATRQYIIDEATRIAKEQGITPERALYNYADTNKIGVQDIDTYMGWAQGTTAGWATNNVPGFAPVPPPPGAAPTAPQGPLTTVPTAPPTAPAQPAPAAPHQPQYQMPVLNALYQNQQQRMTSEAPRFNFQAQQPGQTSLPQQPGALTNVISNT